MIRRLYDKYKDLIPYCFFGVLTTLINWAVYKLFYDGLGVPNVPSTVVAWVLAVVFAFITNKLWVFNSKSFAREVVLREATAFFSARLLTGLLDVLIMWVSVDLMDGNSDLWKLISNVIVIILNYIASKLLIFKNNDK